ncbi:PASTA domain-containing protein [Isoptericola sp. NPDC057191]|uniref:PASTA domain-containing protein n=1 Tax=Isoptericola sp. NPDC057191 TaxID=3346041 RepID=UPI0036314807
MRSPRDADEVARVVTAESPVRRRRRVGKLLATSTATCVLAAAFFAAPVAGLPWNAVGVADQDTPAVGAGSPLGGGVSVGVVGTSSSTGPATVEEVLGVLERAELASKDAGRAVTPQVEQAAAELGMLLSRYVAQQSAASAAAGQFATPGAEAATPLATPVPDRSRDGSPAEPVAVPDAAHVVPVAHRVTGGPATPEPKDEPKDEPQDAPKNAPQDEAEHDASHDAEPVTFDDVVVAATRLATLLDPSTTTLTGGILPAGTSWVQRADGTVAARATLTASLLELVDRYGKSTAGYANGRIPTSALCPLDFAPGHMLRCDAAEQLMALSAEYEKEFGVPIPMTDSYRTFDAQVRLKATKGYLAATPGWSNHGWGLAVDLGVPISSGTTAQYVWMRVHGPDYGWDNPSWARHDGSKPEPWHFEFFAAGPVPNRAWKAEDVGSTGSAGSTGTAQEKAAQHPRGAGQGADQSTDKSKGTGQGAKADGTTSKGGTTGGAKPGGTKGGASTTPGTKAGDGTTSAPIKKPSGGTSDGSTQPPVTKVLVPDVSGQDLAAAKSRLQGLGLKVTTTTQASDAPEGQVVRTAGAGTRVPKGATVTLVVSSGPEQAVVPDVVGQGEQSAAQAVRDVGLVPRVVSQASGEVPEGDVLGTDPAGGTSVEQGSAVTLVVSSGPEQVAVPDVTGKSLANATAQLEALGLSVRTEPGEGDGAEGVVLETRGAGTTVPQGSTVTLVVSTGGTEGESSDGGSTSSTDKPAAREDEAP